VRIRSILYILFIASFIGVFFYSNILSEKIDDDFRSDSIRKSSIQLSPFPIVISKNSRSQNTILYDLLINKSEKAVVLYDTEVDLGEFGKVFPFDTKHLVLEFKYNLDKGRLEFTGSDLESRKIYGYCLITNKNNIRYDVNIEHEKYKLQIESIHNPDNENSGVFVEGVFKFHSNMRDALSLVTPIRVKKVDDREISIRGDFSSKDNLLTLSNIKIQNHKMNIDAEIDFSTTSPLFQINATINNLNFDKIKEDSFGIDDVILAQDLLESFAKFNFKVNFSSKDVNYKAMTLKNASLSLNSKNSSEIEMSNLSFEFADKGLFETKGIFSNAKFYPHYRGGISLKNAQYKNLVELFDLPESKFKNKKKITIFSDISLHPSLVALKNLNIYEGKKILEAKHFQYSLVNSHRSIVTGDVRVNKDINNSNVINALVKKYSDVESSSKEKNIIDINFALTKDLNGKNEREVNLNYIYDNSIRIHNITFSKSKLEASMEIDTKSRKFTVSFNSNEVDLNLLHESMQDFVYMGDFSDINNRVFSKQHLAVSGMPGEILINLQGKENQDLKNLKCNLSYIDDKATFSDCFLDTSVGKILLSGKVGKNKKGMYYDIAYRGDKISLSPGILSNIGKEVVQDSNGKFDLQGYIESKGANASELSRNMVGSMAVKFFDVKLKHIPNFSEDNESHILSLVKGNFDFSSILIKSNNIEYFTESKKKGMLLLERDLVKNFTKIGSTPEEVS